MLNIQGFDHGCGVHAYGQMFTMIFKNAQRQKQPAISPRCDLICGNMNS
jgi:hypothetical protein